MIDAIREELAGGTWSEDQIEGLVKLVEGIESGEREQIVAGYAGTGKTTLLRWLVEHYAGKRPVVALAPTGKAASVIAGKIGRAAPVSTIHRAMYARPEEEESGEEGGRPRLLWSHPHSVAEEGALVVVDEASMVGLPLYQDMMRTLARRVQVVFFGDPGQLPPVNEEPGPKLAEPTVLLSKIHRQAEGSDIITMAHRVREGRDLNKLLQGHLNLAEAEGIEGYFSVRLVDAMDWFVDRRKRGMDPMMLCYTNDLRHMANQWARVEVGLVPVERAKGILSGTQDTDLHVGDRIVGLMNRGRLVNGEVFDVVEVIQQRFLPYQVGPALEVAVRSLSDGAVSRVWVPLKWMGPHAPPMKELSRGLRYLDESDDYARLAQNLGAFDYGLTLTVHKSQGSQAPAVAVLVEPKALWMQKKEPLTYRKWLYTALTRAEREVAVFWLSYDQ